MRVQFYAEDGNPVFEQTDIDAQQQEFQRKVSDLRWDQIATRLLDCADVQQKPEGQGDDQLTAVMPEKVLLGFHENIVAAFQEIQLLASLMDILKVTDVDILQNGQGIDSKIQRHYIRTIRKSALKSLNEHEPFKQVGNLAQLKFYMLKCKEKAAVDLKQYSYLFDQLAIGLMELGWNWQRSSINGNLVVRYGSSFDCIASFEMHEDSTQCRMILQNANHSVKKRVAIDKIADYSQLPALSGLNVGGQYFTEFVDNHDAVEVFHQQLSLAFDNALQIDLFEALKSELLHLSRDEMRSYNGNNFIIEFVVEEDYIMIPCSDKEAYVIHLSKDSTSGDLMLQNKFIELLEWQRHNKLREFTQFGHIGKFDDSKKKPLLINAIISRS